MDEASPQYSVPAAVLDRITLSRVTLAKARSAGGLGGPLESDAMMVWDEIAELQKIADAYPSKAGAIAKLQDEWRDWVRGRGH